MTDDDRRRKQQDDELLWFTMFVAILVNLLNLL